MEEYKGMYGHLLISIQQAVGAASNQHTQILRASQAAHEESIQALKNENLELRRKVEFLNKQIDFLLADETSKRKTVKVGKQRINIDWSKAQGPSSARWTAEDMKNAQDESDRDRQQLPAERSALRAAGKRKGTPSFSLAAQSTTSSGVAEASAGDSTLSTELGLKRDASYFEEQAPSKQACMPNRRRTFVPSVQKSASNTQQSRQRATSSSAVANATITTTATAAGLKVLRTGQSAPVGTESRHVYNAWPSWPGYPSAPASTVPSQYALNTGSSLAKGIPLAQPQPTAVPIPVQPAVSAVKPKADSTAMRPEDAYEEDSDDALVPFNYTPVDQGGDRQASDRPARLSDFLSKEGSMHGGPLLQTSAPLKPIDVIPLLPAAQPVLPGVAALSSKISTSGAPLTGQNRDNGDSDDEPLIPFNRPPEELSRDPKMLRRTAKLSDFLSAPDSRPKIPAVQPALPATTVHELVETMQAFPGPPIPTNITPEALPQAPSKLLGNASAGATSSTPRPGSGPKPLDYTSVLQAMCGDTSVVPVTAPIVSITGTTGVDDSFPTLSKLAAVQQLSSAMAAPSKYKQKVAGELSDVSGIEKAMAKATAHREAQMVLGKAFAASSQTAPSASSSSSGAVTAPEKSSTTLAAAPASIAATAKAAPSIGQQTASSQPQLALTAKSSAGGQGKGKPWHEPRDKEMRARIVKNMVEKSAEHAALKTDAEWLRNRLLYCQALERMLYKNADSRLQYYKAIAETR